METGTPLLDLCGSGTILAEAAQMLAGIPPGMQREFAFEKFADFDESVWQQIRNRCEAQSDPLQSQQFSVVIFPVI